MPAPDWINSPYITLEFGNWTISEDAPQSLKEEFNNWMEKYSSLKATGTIV